MYENGWPGPSLSEPERCAGRPYVNPLNVSRSRSRFTFTFVYRCVKCHITPTYSTWKAAGVIMARLVQRKLLNPGGFKRSFPNDCLLAASCWENGVVLRTDDRDDFELIRRVYSFEVEAPWPEWISVPPSRTIRGEMVGAATACHFG